MFRCTQNLITRATWGRAGRPRPHRIHLHRTPRPLVRPRTALLDAQEAEGEGDWGGKGEGDDQGADEVGTEFEERD